MFAISSPQRQFVRENHVLPDELLYQSFTKGSEWAVPADQG